MCRAGNFYLWLFQLIALLGILALCLWLSLRPKHPTFTIVELTVPSVKNTSTGEDVKDNKEGTINYTLEINNPSKDSTVYYDEILLIFYFGQDSEVGKNTIPAFEQGKGDKIQKSNHVDTNDQKVVRAIHDKISKGTAGLKVDLATKIKYKTWGVKSKHHEVKLEATIPVGSDGKILGKRKKIQLRRPSKKWKLRANKFL